ncbi:MAG: hypothetical protein EAZ30_10555 [Betaproteobacteria bacterium]|nr:MAG: hypothetical protein EAZ30_10555 [Betaproteobacteria bacterium]
MPPPVSVTLHVPPTTIMPLGCTAIALSDVPAVPEPTVRMRLPNDPSVAAPKDGSRPPGAAWVTDAANGTASQPIKSPRPITLRRYRNEMCQSWRRALLHK